MDSKFEKFLCSGSSGCAVYVEGEFARIRMKHDAIQLEVAVICKIVKLMKLGKF